MNKSEAAQQITKAYNLQKRTGWATMVEVAEVTDLTPEQMAAGVRHLLATDVNFEVMPESNRKILGPMDLAYAVPFAGDDNHLMTWR